MKHQVENLRGFSERGENKQLLIAIVAVAQLVKINDLMRKQKYKEL